jgi:CPA2 family monovalent cation:H+ antiporter-2
VADIGSPAQLAEIGVMLLMFGVGLHFSLDDLLAVRIACRARWCRWRRHGAGRGPGHLVGLGRWAAALVFGLSLSVASTVVLLRALEAAARSTPNGRIAVGWLVVEDLAMVLVLVLLPPLAGVLGGTAVVRRGPAAGCGWQTLLVRRCWRSAPSSPDADRRPAGVPLAAVAGGAHRLARAVHAVRDGRRGQHRLRRVALFGVSFALGAFFAGMVLRESEFSHRAAEETAAAARRLRGAVLRVGGHAVRPAVLVDKPLQVLAVVGHHRARQVAGRRWCWCWPCAIR